MEEQQCLLGSSRGSSREQVISRCGWGQRWKVVVVGNNGGSLVCEDAEGHQAVE